MENCKFRVSVCLVTHNRLSLLMGALGSIKKQTYCVDDVVVVDNASSDGTSELICTQEKDVKLIQLHKNLGCPAARNIALANSGGDYLASLDDDGAFAPDAIENAVNVFQKYPETGIVMMDIIEEGESRFPDRVDEQSLPVFSGGCCIFKKKVLDDCGFYDDGIFRQGEEYDYSIKLFQNGWDIRFARNARMFHFPPVNLKENPQILFLGALSKMLAVVKYAPSRFVFPDLIKRYLGYSYLLAKKGRPDLGIKLSISFFQKLPTAVRARTVMPMGYLKSKQMHKTYRKSR